MTLEQNEYKREVVILCRILLFSIVIGVISLFSLNGINPVKIDFHSVLFSMMVFICVLALIGSGINLTHIIPRGEIDKESVFHFICTLLMVIIWMGAFFCIIK